MRDATKMINNDAARTLFEFIGKHNLTLRSVANQAKISDGAIRNFRDIPGRKLNKSTKIAIASALRSLTGNPIDIVAMFGDKSDIVLQGELDSVSASTTWNKDERHRQQSIQLPIDLPIRKVYLLLPIKSGRQAKENFKSIPAPHEQDIIISSEIIGQTARPPTLLFSRDAYALYVPDSEMWPRLEQDTLIYVDPDWPAVGNDDVVVYIKSGDFAGHSFLAFLPGDDNSRDEYCFSSYSREGAGRLFKKVDVVIHKILRGQELIIR